MAKLGDRHIETARTMRGGGSSVREIVEALNKTYGIDTYSGAVAKVCKGISKSGVEKKKHAYHRHGPKDTDEASLDRLMQDVITLLKEIPAGYKKVFLHLRKELLISRTEVYRMLTGAGIDAPESVVK